MLLCGGSAGGMLLYGRGVALAVVLFCAGSAGGIGVACQYRSATAVWKYPHSVSGPSSDCGRRHLSIQ